MSPGLPGPDRPAVWVSPSPVYFRFQEGLNKEVNPRQTFKSWAILVLSSGCQRALGSRRSLSGWGLVWTVRLSG